MPTIRPISVVSFSSEDPNHPASNLLKGDTFRKWKCKEPGEKVAFVILQLEKAVQITGIDIGNEHSAFVEVQVARSGQTPQQFKTLLSQSSFMTPQDSRNSTNTNRVRMFGLDKFDKTVAAEKWDLIKVICVQEFNTHVQFGISFINITAAPDPNEKPKIGGFSIRPALGEEDEEPEPVRIGSLFAKKLQAKGPASPNNGSAAASIRTASSSLALASAAIQSSEERVKELKKQKVVLSDEEQDIKIAPRPTSSPVTVNSNSRSKSWYGSPPKKANESSSESNGVEPSGASTKAKSQPAVATPEGQENEGDQRPTTSRPSGSHPTPKSLKAKRKKKRIRKPFSKLMEDVVFVMSGYQNPYRAELRRKACEMGARCKPDWDSTCTHLICAFVNTPKFREVRQSGHGKIVKKEWIEACYRDRRRYPWRRYCLDWNDQGDESEEEIFAELSSGEEEMEEEEDEEGFGGAETGEDKGSRKRGAVGGTQRNGRKTAAGSSQPVDENNDDEDVVVTPKKRKRILVFDEDDEEEGGNGNQPVVSNEKDSILSEGKKENEDRGESKAGGRRGGSDDRHNDGDDDEDQLSESYLADTDVEERDDGEDREGSSSPSMLANYINSNANVSDFFDGNVFLFHVTDASNERRREDIERIIRLHKGEVETSHTSRVDYVLTDTAEWQEDFSEAMAENPNLTFIRWEWIEECEKKNEMIPSDPYMILPN